MRNRQAAEELIYNWHGLFETTIEEGGVAGESHKGAKAMRALSARSQAYVSFGSDGETLSSSSYASCVGVVLYQYY